MLQSFSDATTEQIWKGQAVRRIPTDLQRQALKRLMYLNAAKRLEDLYQTSDTALRLSRYFGNSAEFWLNLQAEYDLRMADSKRIEAEVAPRAA